MERELAIGIDLGTTCSYLAFMPRDGSDRVRLAKCSFSQTIDDYGLPSRVYMAEELEHGTQRIGLSLGSERVDCPPGYRPVSRFKRVLGRSRSAQRLPEYYVGQREVVKEGKPGQEEVYAYPEAIAGFLLWQMKQIALQTQPEFRNARIDNITITVPARSKVGQRKATQFAARLAGFSNEIYVLEEPIAAFLYHYERLKQVMVHFRGQYVLVFDFGGGTCDLSLVECRGRNQLPIVAARQMGNVGGEDIDDLIARLWIERSRTQRIDFEDLSERARDRLRWHACRAKESLASYDRSPEEFIGYLKDCDEHPFGSRTLSQEALTDLLEDEEIETVFNEAQPVRAPIMELVSKLVSNVIREAGIEESQIEALILAGGSSKLALVRSWMREQLPHLEANAIIDSDPESCIAQGAAIHQYYRYHKEERKRKMIVPTLASSIRLDHSYNESTGQWRQGADLGQVGDRLPVEREGLLDSIWVRDVRKFKGQVRVRVVQGNDLTDPLLDASIALGRWPVSFLRVSYCLSEDGVIERFQCIPAHLIMPPMLVPKSKRVTQKQFIEEGERLEGILEQYSLTNDRRIRQIREQYGIHS